MICVREECKIFSLSTPKYFKISLRIWFSKSLVYRFLKKWMKNDKKIVAYFSGHFTDQILNYGQQYILSSLNVIHQSIYILTLIIFKENTMTFKPAFFDLWRHVLLWHRQKLVFIGLVPKKINLLRTSCTTFVCLQQ